MIGTSFTYAEQPYGSVTFTVDNVQPDVQPHYFGEFAGPLKGVPAWKVEGVVTSSSWVGALWGGVAVTKANEGRHPIGSRISVLCNDDELRRQSKVRVAM